MKLKWIQILACSLFLVVMIAFFYFWKTADITYALSEEHVEEVAIILEHSPYQIQVDEDFIYQLKTEQWIAEKNYEDKMHPVCYLKINSDDTAVEVLNSNQSVGYVRVRYHFGFISHSKVYAIPREAYEYIVSYIDN